MVDTFKDINLEIQTRRKELDSLIEKYKNEVHELVKKLTNIPNYICTNSYDSDVDTNSSVKPILCPKEIPVCSNYIKNVKMGMCTNNDFDVLIASINETEYLIQKKIDELEKYNFQHIKDYNINTKDLKMSYTKMEEDMVNLKHIKEEYKKAIKHHDDLAGNNSSLKLKITSNYIQYIISFILVIITIMLTVLNFTGSKIISTEVIMIYISFVFILAFITSRNYYFN